MSTPSSEATPISIPTATLNQPASSVVITSGSRVRIRAPAHQVFTAILDTASYAEWNRWSPSLTFSSSDQSLRVPGSIGILHCEMGSDRFYDVPVKVLEVTSENQGQDSYTLKWQGQMLPRWFGMAERIQTVEKLGDNGDECELRQWESMSGWGVYLLKWVMRVEAQLKDGNLRYAADLKRWCERGQSS